MHASARRLAASFAITWMLAGCAHAAKPAANAPAAPLPSIDKDEIRAVIQAHAPEIRGCWEKRLAADPSLRGKVAIKWIIQPDGSATNATPDPDATTLRDAELHACMAARIATWRFPKPRGGGVAVITYPWIFQTQNGAATVVEPPAARAEDGATIRGCYQRRLAERPGLEGRVVVSFTIRPGGALADVAVVPAGSTLQDPDVHRCITEIVATWTYPGFASDEPARVEVPFVFRREGPGAR